METLTTHLTCSPSLPGLADGIHYLAKQVFVRKVVGVAARKARTVVGLELIDFPGSDLLEVVAHAVAGFQLLAVHQGSCWADVAIHLRRHRCGRWAVVRLDNLVFADLLLPSRDIVEDELRDIGVVANDDEHRRSDARERGPGRSSPTGGNIFRSFRTD
jgi:hypothetical protein